MNSECGVEPDGQGEAHVTVLARGTMAMGHDVLERNVLRAEGLRRVHEAGSGQRRPLELRPHLWMRPRSLPWKTQINDMERRILTQSNLKLAGPLHQHTIRPKHGTGTTSSYEARR